MAQQTQADDVSTELKEAVNGAKGTALAYGSSAPTAKQAADGRWFVQFSTSHGYGRSNALEAARDVLGDLEMAYNPHGATQWLAERYEADRMERDEAEALVQEGLEYVNPRGYTARITGFRASGTAQVEYPDSQFGDSRTEPREGRLVDLLVDGICTVLEDPREDEQEDEGERVMTDGGQPSQGSALEAERSLVAEQEQEQAENPHRHTSVWAAAQNCETHEDGSAPRLGVEYRKKNGNGTARKAGTVEQIEVERPEDHFGQGVGTTTPRIVFRRDDGQQMYVEPDGLYTAGSHAPFVGSVVALTTSTTSTVPSPEALEDAQREGDDSRDSSPTASAPSVDSLEDLAEWVERTSEAHAEVGSTHYSWDIPGFGRQNDPHSGFTAKRGGECAYVEVRGPRSDDLEQALGLLAHQHEMEVSTSSHRATLVPPQGW